MPLTVFKELIDGRLPWFSKKNVHIWRLVLNNFWKHIQSLCVKLPVDEIQHALNTYGHHTAAAECSNTLVLFLYLYDVSFHVLSQYLPILLSFINVYFSFYLFQGLLIFDKRVKMSSPINFFEKKKSSSPPGAQKKFLDVFHHRIHQLLRLLGKTKRLILTKHSIPMRLWQLYFSCHINVNGSSSSAELSQKTWAQIEPNRR